MQIPPHSRLEPLNLAGLLLGIFFAFHENWTVREFCWSFWVGGLLFSWFLTALSCGRILLDTGAAAGELKQTLPFLGRLRTGALRASVVPLTLGAGYLVFNLYSWLFGFYGLFLSVFAEMEPHVWFGRNGFINSDFYSPVIYLAQRYWPIAAGLILAGAGQALAKPPWQTLLRPMHGRVVATHLMVVLMPFISLLTWALFRDNWQPLTVSALLTLFYLTPTRDVIQTGPQPEER